MLKDKTVEKLLDELASKSPAPGGGSVAALTGALAAGLVSMVSRLTISKKRYANVQKEVKEILKASEKLRKELTELIDKDAKAYDQVVKSKGSDLEKALKQAVKVPLTTAQNCKKVLELTERIAKVGNKNALSDAKVAKLLAQSAIKSAVLNVRINLPLIRDEQFKKKVEKALQQ